MLRKKVLSLAFLMLSAVATAAAGQITVDYVGPEVPPGPPGNVSLPYFMNGETSIIFLKFKVPQISQVAVINSFDIYLFFYDDGDGGGEVGNIEFAQPSSNLPLAGFTRLNGATLSAPAVLPISLCPCEVGQVYPSLLDGTFRIRIQRDMGDFYFLGGTAFIDAELVPEPASVALSASGIAAIAGWMSFRRRRSRRPAHGANAVSAE